VLATDSVTLTEYSASPRLLAMERSGAVERCLDQTFGSFDCILYAPVICFAHI